MKMKFAIVCALITMLGVCEAEEFKCQPNAPYIENDCNHCFCGSRGALACTLKVCPDPSYDALYNCKVGTTSQRGCNKCWCVKEYGTVCEDNKC